MKKIIIVMAVLLLALAMTACGGQKLVPPTEPTPTQATATPEQTVQPTVPEDQPTQAPSGKLGTQHDALLTEDVLTAELNVGQTLAIYLNENPSTGYSIKQSDVPAGLTKKMDQYVAEPVESGIVRSGGIHIYSFTADKAGTYHLSAGVYPPGKSEPEKTYDFTITVK